MEKNTGNKQPYIQPVLVTHELLRDITAKASGHANNGFGNGAFDGVPGRSGFTDSTR
jgi:hypothetical protein